jgi:hypothetical protein
MKGRYFMLPLLDGWTTVFGVPGTRTTGTGAQKFAITGPGWTGNTSGGGQGVQVADRYSVVARPHLLHGNPRRLQGWARTSGSDVYEGSTLEKSGYIVIPPQM